MLTFPFRWVQVCISPLRFHGGSSCQINKQGNGGCSDLFIPVFNKDTSLFSLAYDNWIWITCSIKFPLWVTLALSWSPFMLNFIPPFHLSYWKSYYFYSWTPFPLWHIRYLGAMLNPDPLQIYFILIFSCISGSTRSVIWISGDYVDINLMGEGNSECILRWNTSFDSLKIQACFICVLKQFQQTRVLYITSSTAQSGPVSPDGSRYKSQIK